MTEAGRVPSTNPLDNLDCKYMSSGISNSSMYPGISLSKNGGVKRKKYIKIKLQDHFITLIPVHGFFFLFQSMMQILRLVLHLYP